MERAKTEERLRAAKMHVALGREHIGRQRQIVLDLEQAGHDVTLVRKLLHQFGRLQAMHEAEVDRLTEALARRPR